MNDDTLKILESWAEGLYAEHDRYWNRPYKEIMADKIAAAERFGFIPCPKCSYKIAIGPTFGHLSLAFPDWDGNEPPPISPCQEHKKFFDDYHNTFDTNRAEFHNLELWKILWNSEICALNQLN